MKKVFFFDIDGTLAISHHVPENNIKALQRLKALGYDTFICTGRAPFYAQKLFGDLVSGYICCNGRYILYHDQKLHGEAFTAEETILEPPCRCILKNLTSFFTRCWQAFSTVCGMS